MCLNCHNKTSAFSYLCNTKEKTTQVDNHTNKNSSFAATIFDNYKDYLNESFMAFYGYLMNHKH